MLLVTGHRRQEREDAIAVRRPVIVDRVSPRVAVEAMILISRTQVSSERMIVCMIAHGTFVVGTREVSATLARKRPESSSALHALGWRGR